MKTSATATKKRRGSEPGEGLAELNAKYAPYVISQDIGIMPGWRVKGPGMDYKAGGGTDGGWLAATCKASECSAIYRLGRASVMDESQLVLTPKGEAVLGIAKVGGA